MVGRACGVKGIRPGAYCEPKMTSVGSQDTTGPMTRDELKDLACLGFSADLVMQSFCHTAAYPKPVDVNTHHTLPEFIMNRGGVSLRPGDGVIHSWLNRMLLPYTVGTGGDSHTRFPIGISFPAGSGLVAFAAATGVMPLDMPESVLVRFACLGFSADLVMQSFCHTAAYPKPVDVNTHHTLPDFIMNRGGVSLRPGDGVIHSWLNRMLLPDTVGTGGDSHTRFPIGISFPAGSGLVAFAAATGVMPLDIPESVLVRFKGKMQPGITLRDLVHAIPLYAIKQGLLTVEKKGKKNIFSGRILEIEGLPDLKVEQAFELTDASAERSAAGCTIKLNKEPIIDAAGCTIKLNKEPIIEYLNSNIVLLKWMIAEGYGDRRTLERRIQGMETWLATPELLEADADAEYAAVIDIDRAGIKEPILGAPNDPDDARPLSAVQGEKIDEVFIGS